MVANNSHFDKPFNPINWPAVPHDFTGDNNLGIYTAETTQRYVYGTRYITWDGRVYKYMGLTTGGCVSYHGVAGTLSAQTEFVTALAGTAGDRAYTVTDTSTIAEDQLAGGMIELYKATIDNSTSVHIVGNDASNGTNVRLFLEFPLSSTMTSSDNVEVYENQYRLVSEATNQIAPWLGIPTVTAATGNNVWSQTWGPALVSPGNTTIDDAAADERMAFWMPNAVIGESDGAGITAGKNQVAGYIWNVGTGGIAGPQIYLMCST